MTETFESSLRDWTTRPLPGEERLEGRHVVLEPLDWAVHADGLFAAVAGPQNADIWRFMPAGPFAEIGPFKAFMNYVIEAQTWRVLVFRRAGDGHILGMSSYMRNRPEHGSTEIGCVAFGPDLKRTIAATEAMYLMAAHVFDGLGYRRYEWKCHNKNDASKRAAERLGFAFEGIFRNDMVVRGESRDTAWYAMTDSDWPALKQALETWLSADNFDPQGQQKQSLEAFRA